MRNAAVTAEHWGLSDLPRNLGRSVGGTLGREEESAPAIPVCYEDGWNSNFAREQLRNLVRRVFFSAGAESVRQIVFSAMEPATDVGDICREVGELLAVETGKTVAISELRASEQPESVTKVRDDAQHSVLRRDAIKLRPNLWLVTRSNGSMLGSQSGTEQSASALHSYISELRRDFEYSILAGPSAAHSEEAAVMGQHADGLILVLSASDTRRAAAQHLRDKLKSARVHLLGAVLADRDFPIPEGIYRRL